MTLDSFAQTFASWSGPGVKIAAAATAIYSAYQKLEPTTKASIEADLKTIEAEWMALNDALTAYDKDDGLSQVKLVFALKSVAFNAVPVLTRVFTDIASVSKADWQTIKPQVDIILTSLKGTPA